MDTKEALQRLQMLHLVAEDPEDKVAIQMAIQALKHPEIIRCKDCKYCEEIGPKLFFCNSVDIVPVGQYVEPDGFCSMARRREQ